MDARIAWLRIAACYLVVLLHVSSGAVDGFGQYWWQANIFDSLSRVSVPIFLMISGYTLLGKEEPLLLFVRKRFTRVFPPLIFWSLFYLWWLSSVGKTTNDWASAIVHGPVIYHLWYLYAIVGIYAVVPILRRFYQGSSKAEKMWVLGLWFIVGSAWPALADVVAPGLCRGMTPTSTATAFHLSAFSGYAWYLLLGAVVGETKVSKTAGFSLYFAASLVTGVAAYVQSTMIGYFCTSAYDYLSPAVILGAVGFFMAFMSMDKWEASPTLMKFADCTLGVYCLHLYFIMTPFELMGIRADGPNMWILAPSVALLAFVVSMASIYVVRLVKIGRIVT